MWDSLKRSDIHEARQQIKRRREEVAKRHAEEIGQLDGDRAELETLQRLAETFAHKYKTSVSTVEQPTVASPPAPAAIAAHKPMPDTRPADRRDYARSNFETFARAVSKPFASSA
jgi:hypothetical protein